MSAGSPAPEQSADSNATLVHATTVALGDYAALLRGSPGAGKSDLALRFLAGQGLWPDMSSARTLVADDQTLLHVEAGRLIAAAPVFIAGLIEVRGVGIVRAPALPRAEVRLIVDLGSATEVERLPDPLCTQTLLGVPLPWRRLNAFEASAAHKLALLLRQLTT